MVPQQRAEGHGVLNPCATALGRSGVFSTAQLSGENRVIDAVHQCENAAPLPVNAIPEEPAVSAPQEGDLIESELLIEEVSIDGMCGVY
jgi:mycofactocin precursor